MRFNDLIKPVQVPHEVFKFKKENQACCHDFTNTLDFAIIIFTFLKKKK